MTSKNPKAMAEVETIHQAFLRMEPLIWRQPEGSTREAIIGDLQKAKNALGRLRQAI